MYMDKLFGRKQRVKIVRNGAKRYADYRRCLDNNPCLPGPVAFEAARNMRFSAVQQRAQWRSVRSSLEFIRATVYRRIKQRIWNPRRPR